MLLDKYNKKPEGGGNISKLQKKHFNQASGILQIVFILSMIYLMPAKGLALTVEEVEKITDQNKLSEIVQKDFNPNARLLAVEKITDRTLLAKIAQEDPVDLVRAEAKHRLDGGKPRYFNKKSMIWSK